MQQFRYRALSSDGAVVSGEMHAPSEAAVIQRLRNLGHFPLIASTHRKTYWTDLSSLRPTFKKGISTQDLVTVTVELAALLRAGVDLERALSVLHGLGETRAFHEVLARILARVRDGESFADALAFEPSFPKLYIGMVRAGEMGGQLDASISRLAEYLTRAQMVRDSVGSALVYPIILLVTAGLSIITILVFVLPQFEPLFADAGKSLPLATRVVLSAGHFVARFGWLLMVLSIAGGWWFRWRLKSRAFRFKYDGIILALPLIGDLLRKFDTERLCRTLGTLLANGVPLPTALDITKSVLSNSVMAEAVGNTGASLREGEALAARLARTKVFPAMTIDLVRVGEESGKLDEMLLRQAELFERSIKHTVDRLLALLVPVLTIVLGLIVAGLIGSMLVAILSVNDLAL